MNEEDIQLITSLIGGELSEPERQAALARIDTEPEMRAAYDEQLAVASLLKDTPPAALTTAEADALRATLVAELRLGDTAEAVAAASTSRWARWWAPLTGLAAAAVIVVAVVVVPNLGEDAQFDEVGALTGTPTTAAFDPMAGVAEPEQTTTAAAEEAPSDSEASALEDSAMMRYSIDPEAAKQRVLSLPVVDPESLALSDFNAAMARSLESDTVDNAALTGCFDPDAVGNELTPVGLTEDGSSVYATTNDPQTGEETVKLINLETCEVSDG